MWVSGLGAGDQIRATPCWPPPLISHAHTRSGLLPCDAAVTQSMCVTTSLKHPEAWADHYEPSSSVQPGRRLVTAQQEASEPGQKRSEVWVSLCPGDWSWNLGLLCRGSCSWLITDYSPPSYPLVTDDLCVNTCMIYTQALLASCTCILKLQYIAVSKYAKHKSDMKRCKPGLGTRSICELTFHLLYPPGSLGLWRANCLSNMGQDWYIDFIYSPWLTQCSVRHLGLSMSSRQTVSKLWLISL